MVKGKGTETCAEGLLGCDTITANAEEIHPVTCCSDVEIAGWVKGQYGSSWCNVWVTANLPDCKQLNWLDASNVCKSQSGRLCTREEIEEECAAGAGCSYNNRLLWSSTPEGNGRYDYY